MIRGPNRETEGTREGCAVGHVLLQCEKLILVFTSFLSPRLLHALRRIYFHEHCQDFGVLVTLNDV